MRNNRYVFYVKRDASNSNLVDRIKWCRENLGERGKDWDFLGGAKMVEIHIYTEKLASFYKLSFEFFNEDITNKCLI